MENEKLKNNQILLKKAFELFFLRMEKLGEEHNEDDNPD
jgi:hypothetical protein